MHLSSDCNNSCYANRKIADYMESSSPESISSFIPSLNPKILTLTCKKDCSNSCLILKKSVEKVCPFECENRDRHRVVIVDGLNGNLIAYCTKCDEIIYEGKDPLRKYNIELMEICKTNNSAMPNLLLTISNSTINDEVKFYEENFANYFLGYKIHQSQNMRSINSLRGIDSMRTILVHSDRHAFDSIYGPINFAKRYKGNIVLAHSYLLENPFFIRESCNLYYDVCPTDNLRKYMSLIPHNGAFNCFDNIYDVAISYLPEDRILFGTDWPYGDIKSNIDEVLNSHLSDNQKEKVLSLNAKRAYHL